MITSRKDYLDYLAKDQEALGIKGTLKDYLVRDTWKFQRLLRKLEYQQNCGANRLLRLVTHLRFRRISKTLGFTIPPNCFGPGLSIAHRGTIVVNRGARIGANCRIHVDVNIGTAAGKDADAPIIGDNAYIAPGAKLFGLITLGDNVKIGANAVVTKSFPDDAVLLGVPAVNKDG